MINIFHVCFVYDNPYTSWKIKNALSCDKYKVQHMNKINKDTQYNNRNIANLM